MSPPSLLDLCVAGRWRPGSGEVYETCYPATGEPVAALRTATPADVDEAIDKLKKTLDIYADELTRSGEWSA